MSDSEEEFASADEGDVEDKTTKNVKKKKETVQKEEAARKPEAKDIKSEQLKGKNTKKAKGAKDGDKKQEDPTEKGSATSNHPAAASGNAAAKTQEAKGKKGKQKGGKGKQKSADKTSECEVKADNSSKAKDVAQKPESSDKSENKEVENTQTEVKDSPESESVQPQESTPVKSTVRVADTPEGVNESESMETGSKSEPRLKVDEPSLIKSPSSQSITRPPPDHTEKEEAVLECLANVAAEKKGSGWGWGWGSSLLEVASTSVTTFTKEVGDGLHTMMETVESTLNVPNPEELAKTNNQETDSDDEESESKEETNETSEPEKPKAKTKDKVEKLSTEQKETPSQAKEQTEEKATTSQAQEIPSEASNSWFSSWGVSNISKMVESTSKSLVHGGLDALETLGKKTFDVINERDPGLKKTRGFLMDRGDKPNLSAILRDAKEQEEVRAIQEKETEEARKAHFGSLFDDFQGLAHLEALEMLSNQSEKRVNTLLAALPPDAVSEIKPVLLKVKENFELDEEEEEEAEEQEFELLVTELVNELNVGLTANKLVKTSEKIYGELKECGGTEDTKPDPKELHRIAISGLAELTSKCIEQFHKSGELILLQKAELSDFVKISQTLLRLTKVLSAQVGILSGKFTTELNKLESGDEIKVNHLVTNVYLEATNSSSYIQDGFQLLLPVLQQATIEKSQEPVS